MRPRFGKLPRSFVIATAIALSTLAINCGPTAVNEANGVSNPGERVVVDPEAARVESSRSQDAAPDVPRMIQLEVFDLTVPAGSISRNTDFWKRIDEEFMGFERQSMLDKNGLRIGRAGVEELAQLGQHLDALQPRKSIVTAQRADEMEFEMTRTSVSQTLFVFDQTGDPVGRDFGPSNNVVYLSFRQALRNPQSVRVALAPAVRGVRSRLEYSGRGEELKVRDAVPEFRYNELDLNFEIPPDQFVIVAQSSKGTMDTSLGRAFFSVDTPAERMERVLIIRPKSVVVLGGR